MQQRPISIEQRHGPNILIRLLYFFLFGFWFSGIWTAIGWILCVTIIGFTGWFVDAQSDAASGNTCTAAREPGDCRWADIPGRDTATPAVVASTLVHFCRVVVERNMAFRRMGIECIDHWDGYCLLDVRSSANNYHPCPSLMSAKAGV